MSSKKNLYGLRNWSIVESIISEKSILSLKRLGTPAIVYLQNSLKYAGFDTFDLLCELTEDDIKSLEIFAREDLHQILDPHDDRNNSS